MTITKQDLEKALSSTKKDLEKALVRQDERSDEKFKKQDEKFLRNLNIAIKTAMKEHKEYFGQLLNKYFYTKDEVDRKLIPLATKDDVKNAVNEGVDRVKVLFEDNKSKIELIAEGHGLLADKVDNLDRRFTKLEKTV